jgi:hypothetical protein
MKTSRRSALLLLLALTATPFQTVTARTSPIALEQAGDVAAKAPAVVFLIRHGEKPLTGKDPDLSPMGYQRAQAIPSLFLAKPGSTKLPRLPRPDALFATAPSKNSNRPIETITPLSQALHLRIDEDFSDDDAAPLAKEVLSGKYAGKVVLICWHHGEIPNVAQAFGVTNAPRKWDPGVFDQIWMLEWIDGKVQFTTLPEVLLSGDSKK